jgi:Arc/MetJ family transcription regulator
LADENFAQDDKWNVMEARYISSFDAIIDAQELFMRTTIALDDELVRAAQEFTGVEEKTALVREALKALIERESARRLAALGGSMPGLKDVPRRRTVKR